MHTDHLSLAGKSIIVTGAAQGIGRALRNSRSISARP